jgi:hypothetical protein
VTTTGDPVESAATRDEEPAVEPLVFDRHLVLEQLGGWRGMLDATLPTLAFIVANGLGGLRAGIWAALATALVVFALRLARRETLQQAVSGLIGVAIAVAIARASGEARDFFVVGILRSAVIAVVLFLSVAVRRPLVGVAAEFLAPSHLGALATHSLPGFGRRSGERAAAAARPARGADEPGPQRHWREDPRLVRAYGWLTVLWGATFALRALVQYVLYREDDVALLGTMSIVLGLPVTAVALAITLWVVSRLHRHRTPEPDPAG